jgi:hypothetical protein
MAGQAFSSMTRPALPTRPSSARGAKRGPVVVTSLPEGGDELLTFFRFPKAQWKRYGPRIRLTGSTKNSAAG